MRPAVFAVALAAWANAAQAIDLSGRDATAAGVAKALETRNSVIVETGPGTFDRFVRSAGQCDNGLTAPGYDSRGRFLGYVCAPNTSMPD